VVVGEGMTFYSAEEVIIAFNEGKLSKHAYIKVRVRAKDKKTGEMKCLNH
jgi:DNA-directed RNA polymerase subunit beta'